MKIKSMKNFMSKRKMLEQARHPFEIPFVILSIAISIFFYSFLVYWTTNAKNKEEIIDWLCNDWTLEEEVAADVVKFGKYIVLAIVIFILLKVIWSFFRDIGSATARDVQVSEVQSAEVEVMFDKYTDDLGLLLEPNHCVCKEESAIEVLSVPVKNKYCIRVPAVYIYNAVDDDEDYTLVRFIIAKELSHIALSHRNLLLLLLVFPSQLIPLYNALYGRILTYSADRLTAEIIGVEDTIKGIIWSENDADYGKFELDFDNYRERLFEKRSGFTNFAKVIENLSSAIPIPEYRIKRLMEMKKDE